MGVGFGVQLGDVVQAAYDYVNIAWQTVLAGGVFLLGTLFLLQAVDIVDGWVAGAACLSVCLGLCLANSHTFLGAGQPYSSGCGRFSGLCGRDPLPAFAALVHSQGARICPAGSPLPAIQEAADGLADFKQEVAPDSRGAKIRTSWSRLSRSTEAVRRMGDFLKGKNRGGRPMGASAHCGIFVRLRGFPLVPVHCFDLVGPAGRDLFDPCHPTGGGLYGTWGSNLSRRLVFDPARLKKEKKDDFI